MPRDVDEDLIEATIRRVAESKAQRPEPQIEMPVADAVAPEPSVWKRETADDYEDDGAVAPAAGFAAAAAAPAPLTPLASPAPAPADADEISLALFEITQTMQVIGQRLDAIVPLLEKIARDGSVSPQFLTPVPENGQPRSPITGPWQAPQTQGSTALEPQVIDTRPIPKPLPPLHVEPKRGLDLLPRNYRITVEDKRRGVDLVPLHRALLSMDGVRDMALLSYNNGVAIVSLEATVELDPDALGASVGRAMSREARVEVHNEHTMVVKLAEE